MESINVNVNALQSLLLGPLGPLPLDPPDRSMPATATAARLQRNFQCYKVASLPLVVPSTLPQLSPQQAINAQCIAMKYEITSWSWVVGML